MGSVTRAARRSRARALRVSPTLTTVSPTRMSAARRPTTTEPVVVVEVRAVRERRLHRLARLHTRPTNRIVNAMANELVLDRTFAACAHPIRRQIIERLAGREMTVGEATCDFGVSKPAISRHLRVLEDAGTIARVIDGRTHRLRLTEHALEEASGWMHRQRALWERKFAVVEQYLAERAEDGG
jgi:DNA-binding transcriptional ArsR family regulator